MKNRGTIELTVVEFAASLLPLSLCPPSAGKSDVQCLPESQKRAEVRRANPQHPYPHPSGPALPALQDDSGCRARSSRPRRS
jgi:hypothetical protein